MNVKNLILKTRFVPLDLDNFSQGPDLKIH